MSHQVHMATKETLCHKSTGLFLRSRKLLPILTLAQNCVIIYLIPYLNQLLYVALKLGVSDLSLQLVTLKKWLSNQTESVHLQFVNIFNVCIKKLVLLQFLENWADLNLLLNSNLILCLIGKTLSPHLIRIRMLMAINFEHMLVLKIIIYEPYLDIVRNLYKRADLIKLRISAHKLAIETGRYARPFIPSNMRKCLLCDTGEVEDEFHFLLNCTSLKN